MGNWFDGLAKRSARAPVAVDAEAGVAEGLTRRQVLARGAVVTGAAWTAPMLLSAQPAWAVGSCPTDEELVVCSPTVSMCCPAGNSCVPAGGNKFKCDANIGGVCGNRGFGTNCALDTARCNQACSTDREPICGGPGATCDPNSESPQCIEGVECSGVGGHFFCGGEGAACTGGGVDECNPGTCQGFNVQTCCSTAVVGEAGTCQAAACS